MPFQYRGVWGRNVSDLAHFGVWEGGMQRKMNWTLMAETCMPGGRCCRGADFVTAFHAARSMAASPGGVVKNPVRRIAAWRVKRIGTLLERFLRGYASGGMSLYQRFLTLVTA